MGISFFKTISYYGHRLNHSLLPHERTLASSDSSYGGCGCQLHMVFINCQFLKCIVIIKLKRYLKLDIYKNTLISHNNEKITVVVPSISTSSIWDVIGWTVFM